MCAGYEEPHSPTTWLLQVCLALTCTLPLAWRVRYPIATVVVITAAGGLLVAVAVLGFFMFNGGHFGAPQASTPTHMNVTVKEPGKH